MIIILLLCCLSLTARAYNLLKTIEISANNNKIYGVLNMEKSDANLLLVFYFENASYPLALVSEYEITDRDFNRTVKPIFIESKKPIFFDYESIQTHSSKHYIEIPYMESVYYFAKDGFGYFKLKIEVYSKPQSTCTNNCQGYELVKLRQNSTCHQKCHCQDDHFGSYCQFELIQAQKDVKYTIDLLPHKAVYMSFQFDQEATLFADDVIDPITASFGVLGKKGYEIPDQTSYTAILHSQLSLTKLMQSLKQQFQNATTLIIGLQCRTGQKISIKFRQEETNGFWGGNCLFLAFAAFNVVVILICFGITNLCKQNKKTIIKKKKIKVRPPQIEENPKNFSGSFFNKNFEIYEYQDFISINPQFSSNTQCVVCMDELNQKEIAISPCGHVFHYQCLKKWLMKILTCPSCRFEITYEQVRQGGWLGSKHSPSPPQLPQSNSNSELSNDNTKVLIENNDMGEIINNDT